MYVHVCTYMPDANHNHLLLFWSRRRCQLLRSDLWTQKLFTMRCVYSTLCNVVLFCLWKKVRRISSRYSFREIYIFVCLRSIGCPLTIDGKSTWELFLWQPEVHFELQKKYWISCSWGIFSFHTLIVELFHPDCDCMCFQRGNTVRNEQQRQIVALAFRTVEKSPIRAAIYDHDISPGKCPTRTLQIRFPLMRKILQFSPMKIINWKNLYHNPHMAENAVRRS